MLTSLTLDAVDSFLAICRREIPKGHCYFVGSRMLNIDGKQVSAKQELLDLGIMNINEIWDIVINLQRDDCIKVDFDHDFTRDMNSEIFIFQKKINGILVYIKLTMRPRGIICISFHRSY